MDTECEAGPITVQEMLDSGERDWQYVIAPPVMSGMLIKSHWFIFWQHPRETAIMVEQRIVRNFNLGNAKYLSTVQE